MQIQVALLEFRLRVLYDDDYEMPKIYDDYRLSAKSTRLLSKDNDSLINA